MCVCVSLLSHTQFNPSVCVLESTFSAIATLRHLLIDIDIDLHIHVSRYLCVYVCLVVSSNRHQPLYVNPLFVCRKRPSARSPPSATLHICVYTYLSMYVCACFTAESHTVQPIVLCVGSNPRRDRHPLSLLIDIYIRMHIRVSIYMCVYVCLCVSKNRHRPLYVSPFFVYACMPTPTLVVHEFCLRVLLWFSWGVCPCVSIHFIHSSLCVGSESRGDRHASPLSRRVQNRHGVFHLQPAYLYIQFVCVSICLYLFYHQS